jgi:UDP-glucose 4-epimerase
MAQLLVTGAAGFLGANVVEALLAQGHGVVALDDLFTGRVENLPRSRSLTFVQGSVTDFELLTRLLVGIDRVIHLAARNIIASTRNPREDYEVNIGGTLNLLLACRAVPVQRIVYASSASVYGNPRYLPINEDDGVSTLSPYAVSKLAAENYCLAFYENYGLPTVALRYSNVYGPYQHHDNPYSGVVAKFMALAAAAVPPLIHGDGAQTRDFTYVEDAVTATLLAAFTDLPGGQVFNVGTGVETTVNDLCDEVLRLHGLELRPTYIDRRDIDNIRRRVLNIERIRRVLRWIPRFTLKEGLRRTKEWSEALTATKVPG